MTSPGEDEFPSVPYASPPADMVSSFRELRRMYNAAREGGFSGPEAMVIVTSVLNKSQDLAAAPSVEETET